MSRGLIEELVRCVEEGDHCSLRHSLSYIKLEQINRSGLIDLLLEKSDATTILTLQEKGVNSDLFINSVSFLNIIKLSEETDNYYFKIFVNHLQQDPERRRHVEKIVRKSGWKYFTMNKMIGVFCSELSPDLFEYILDIGVNINKTWDLEDTKINIISELLFISKISTEGKYEKRNKLFKILIDRRYVLPDDINSICISDMGEKKFDLNSSFILSSVELYNGMRIQHGGMAIKPGRRG